MSLGKYVLVYFHNRTAYFANKTVSYTLYRTIYDSKFVPYLFLAIKEEQNIFFSETCLASTISKPEFMVCLIYVIHLLQIDRQVVFLLAGI